MCRIVRNCIVAVLHTVYINYYNSLKNPLQSFNMQLYISDLLTYRGTLHEKSSVNVRVEDILSIFFAEKERGRRGNEKPPSIGGGRGDWGHQKETAAKDDGE